MQDTSYEGLVMITKNELNKHGYPTTEEIDFNLDVLLTRLNQLQQACGLVFVITSGLRSMEQQEDLIMRGKSGAVHSKHLIGAAADIYDLSGELNKWCLANFERLEGIGLWCENRQGPWQHVQIFPPASGHRWFAP